MHDELVIRGDHPVYISVPVYLSSPRLSISGSHLAASVPGGESAADMSKNEQSKDQSGVIVTNVPSSPPTLLDQLSGSSSPSISSVGTLSSASEAEVVLQSFGDYDQNDGRASVTNSMSWDSSASWGRGALSASSSEMESLAVSDPENGADSGMYVCLFHMLDCHDTFDDESLWRMHVLSHFRTHPPPSTVRCPLCPDKKFVDSESMLEPDDSSREPDQKHTSTTNTTNTTEESISSQCSAWNRMLNHVAADHYQLGQTLAGCRADFELMRYLYGLRIITDAQFKAMQLAPAPSSPAYDRSQDGVRASIGSSDEPYCAPYSRRREERLKGQQRGVGVV